MGKKHCYSAYGKLIFCISFIVFISGTTHAQINNKPNLLFHNLTLEDGLMQITINDIVQDSYGYIWIASQGGLQRYDGYDFLTFYSDPADTTTIPDGNALSITEDHNFDIWIGTENGLALYNREKQSFQRFTHDTKDSTSISAGNISGITADRNQNVLWLSVAGYGLNKLDLDNHKITHFPYQERGEKPLNIGNTVVDADEQVWATTGNGIAKINHNLQILEKVEIEGLPEIVKAVNVDRNDPNKIWMGGSNSTLVQLDIQNESVTQSLRVDSASNAVLDGIVPDPNYKSIFWTRSLDGLYRVNTQTGVSHKYTKEFADQNEYDQSRLVPIVADKSGFIWGDYWHGISYFDPLGNPFYHYSHIQYSDQALQANGIFDITGGSNNDLWVGYLDKLIITRIDTLNNRFQHYPAPGRVRALANISNQLWIGTNNGIEVRDLDTYQLIHRFTEQNSDLRPGAVSKIVKGPGKNIWIGTTNGLNYFNPSDQNVYEFKTDLTEAKILESVYVRDIEISDDGSLWFATIQGLVRLKLGENSAYYYNTESEPYELTSNNLLQVKYHNGSLWLGSSNAGFMEFRSDSGVVQRYSVQNGLPDNTIYSILADESDNLWMGTNNGLVQFNTTNDEISKYGQNEGQLNQEFNINSAYKSSNGRLYFGGQGGEQSKIVHFKPDEVVGRINSNPPELVLNRIEAQDAETGETEVFSPFRDVVIEPSQKHITVHYAGIHFLNPSQNQYRYMLDGVDDNWIDAGTERSVRFTNLSSGTYTFRLLAANSDGVWTEEPLELTIRVLPPWWKTTWAYLFYTVVILGGIFAVDRIQRRRLIQKERSRAREKELEQAREIENAYHELERTHEHLKAAQEQLVQQEKLASLGQLTAGIAHEIKNPLNFVNNFSDLSIELIEEAREEIRSRKSINKEQESDFLGFLDDVETYLEKIYKHGTRADSIVKSMLQHSKSTSNQKKPTDLNALIKEYVNLSYHGMRAGPKPINVEIQLDLDEKVGKIPLVAEDFSRVIVNLCNNAFEAMHEKLKSKTHQGDENYRPLLRVQTKSGQDDVIIEIEDNGPGIPDEMLDKVMQPFFTTKKGKEGTGLGLSISNDVVIAQGGVLDVHSKLGDGTTWIVKIPRDS